MKDGADTLVELCDFARLIRKKLKEMNNLQVTWLLCFARALDINKVYGALFELMGIFEASHSDGSNPFTRDIAVSKGVAQLDAILNHVTGYDQEKAAYISSWNNMFGVFNDELLKEAESHLNDWFPVPKKTS